MLKYNTRICKFIPHIYNYDTIITNTYELLKNDAIFIWHENTAIFNPL